MGGDVCAGVFDYSTLRREGGRGGWGRLCSLARPLRRLKEKNQLNSTQLNSATAPYGCTLKGDRQLERHFSCRIGIGQRQMNQKKGHQS
jgi:hypothetical protein